MSNENKTALTAGEAIINAMQEVASLQLEQAKKEIEELKEWKKEVDDELCNTKPYYFKAECLRMEAEGLRKEIAELKDVNKAQRTNIEILRADNKQNIKEILELNNKNNGLRAKYIQANKDYIRAMEISFSTSEDNNNLKKEIEKIKGEKKKEYNRAQKLVTETINLQSQLDEVTKELAEKEKEVGDLTDQTEVQQKEIAELKDSRSALLFASNTYSIECINQKKQIQSLQSQLEEVTKERDDLKKWDRD